MTMDPIEPKKPKAAPKKAPAKAAKPAAEPTTPKIKDLTIDYRTGNMPEWVREVIDAHLAIEQEDARKAGHLGFMARALVLATMPYKDPKKDAFMRVNGDFKLRIVAGYEGGIPYGIYPRLLMSWVATEAVRNNSPVIELGDSLAAFLREGLDLRSTGGGTRGSATRVTEQMKRLFGSLVTAQYTGGLDSRGFTLRNVLIADELDLTEADTAKLDGAPAPAGPASRPPAGDDGALWTPQLQEEAGQWQSHVRLSKNFFQECITNPVPIDLRAYKSLRGNPLAMDIYAWLTFRMSYVTKRSRPIPWEALMMQFGTGYSSSAADPTQGVRDFKKAFLRALKLVALVYPDARAAPTDAGLVLAPSRTSIPRSPGGQSELF